jgi:hypothetical protein
LRAANLPFVCRAKELSRRLRALCLTGGAQWVAFRDRLPGDVQVFELHDCFSTNELLDSLCTYPT